MHILSDDDEWTAGLGLSPAIEVKLLPQQADTGVVEGHAASFGSTDHYGDRIEPGAFLATLEAHRSAGTAPAMLWAHDQAQPIGRLTAAGEDGRGLRVRGQLNLDSEAGRKARTHLLAGDLTGMSIGYQVPAGGARRGDNGGRVLSKINLHEVSIVAVPADTNARVISVKSLASRSELEQLLHNSGLARGAARKLAAGGWPALVREEDDFSVLAKALDTHLIELRTMRTSK